MKILSIWLLAVALLAGISLVRADDSVRIQGFSVSPDTSGKQLYLKWTPLAADSEAKISGYAIQWSDRQTEMRTDKTMRLHFEQNTSSASIRGTDFEKNKDYFFRAYPYYDGPSKRVYYSDKSSKIMKWVWKSRVIVDTSWIEPSDPMISSTETDAVTGFSDETFILRVLPFDKTAQFLWSNSNLASSDFDGHQIIISKTADLSNPLKTLKTGRSDRKIYLEGLLPATTYYAKGSFYKSSNAVDQSFGVSEIITFKTSEEFTGRKIGSFQRTITRMRKSGIGRKFTVGSTESTATKTTAAVRSTSSSTTKDSSSIRGQIRELKAEITEREKEIARLEGLLGTKNTSSISTRRATISSRTTTRSASSSRMSLRERLKARLGR